eukprot:SAG31_NODE_11069_length_1069_cov_1.613402_1_plen_69_part_10
MQTNIPLHAQIKYNLHGWAHPFVEMAIVNHDDVSAQYCVDFLIMSVQQNLLRDGIYPQSYGYGHGATVG